MNTIDTILTNTAFAILSNSVVVGFVAWLVKTVVNRQLERDNERFRDKLQADSALAIERFRAGLEKDRIRLQVSYGGIFGQQAVALIDLYHCSVEFGDGANCAIDTQQNSEETARFRESWRKLHECYQRNRILIPASLDAKYSQLVSQFYFKVAQHQRLEVRMQRATSDQAFANMMARQDQLRAAIETELPALQNEMIEIVRRLLGTDWPLERVGGTDA